MSTYRPKVSVIIPVYNGAHLISETLESVLNQTYKDYEIIVADDGSTDDTQAVLERFSASVENLKLPHRGISATRNAAISASRGKYLALLDADDLWMPQKLQMQVECLEEHEDVGLVYSHSVNFTEGSKGESVVRTSDLEGDIFLDLINGRGGFGNSSIMMRRTVFDAVGCYDESLVAMEDYELNLRIARSYKIARIPLPLVKRRIHPGSFYSSGYDNQYIFQLPVYDKVLSDPDVASMLHITKEAFMINFIRKFIFKNLFDGHPEFIPQKMMDLARYGSVSEVDVVRNLVANNVVSTEAWKNLIDHFDVWHADIKHKATLFNNRPSSDFNVGSGRLKAPS